MLIIFSVFFFQYSKAQLNPTDSCAFFGNKYIYPYYHLRQPSNGKDFYTIKKEFTKTITAQTHFSGIITIIFFINYKGETNYYRTQICDLNYKALEITNDNELLCSQVLLAVKQLAPWKPLLDEEKTPINLRKFYSFKFNKGSLIEILPK